MIPSFTIIAGPNGAGKSTTSKHILTNLNIIAFDFDKEFYAKWEEYGFDPHVELGVRKTIAQRFEDHLSDSFQQKSHVSFETNFSDNVIMNHVEKAKSFGYETRLIFIGLKDEAMAIKRVQIRVDRGGHFVSEATIRERYAKGLELLDKFYNEFDSVTIHESLRNFKAVVCMTFHNEGITLFRKPSFIHHIPKTASKL
ncbi:MAG: zeta toxin family protein [Cyclobacteriaceae bacterium]